MTAVVGYRRVSSADQRFDRQNLGVVDKLFEDQSSGKDRQRPGLSACLAYVREGDTLRCHSADRLARSLTDLIALVEELTERGVRVEFVKEGMAFDRQTADPYSVCLMQVMGAFAELERSLIRVRQAEGIAAAKQRGVYRGRKPALTPEEVLTARRRRADGVTLARLVRDFGVSKRHDAAGARGHRRLRGSDRVTGIEVTDPVALEAALEALPEGCWLEVTVGDERLLVVRVKGGWHLPGDLTVTSGDVADGEPSKVEVLGDDGYLPVKVAIREARAEFARARAAEIGARRRR